MEAIASIRSRPEDLVSPLLKFWEQHPALYYGLAFLLGCSAAASHQLLALLPPFAILLVNHWQRSLLACILALAAFGYTHERYLLPEIPATGLEGAAYISIQSISDSSSSYGYGWVFKGVIHSFVPQGETESIARGVSFRMTVPKKGRAERPTGDTNYIIHSAKLRKTANGTYYLNSGKQAHWYPVDGWLCLAEMRFNIKHAVKRYIQDHIADRRSANLLVGLVTGEFSDQQTRSSLGRFGLQHILAISGFHFAIIVSILALCFSMLLPRKACSIALLIATTSYYIVLGFGPSIMRAYICATIFLLGQLLDRPAKALNSMGIALLAILLYDPLSATSAAFQLSFVATAAILLLFKPMDEFLALLWNRRSLAHISEMSLLDQHGFLILSIFRQALALSLAVHLLTIPVCLYYFQKFPVLSLFYNLFFPFLVSISMLLLITASITQLGFLHTINSALTQTTLNLTFNVPLSWDIMIRTHQPPVWLVVAATTTIFAAAVYLRQRSLEPDFI
ncbi:MAG: ComEC/Rec2 family competence protein [Chlamydiales bacterium]|nr:ComEC/Rec2 family competence protein [Chlamydiales bacterium]